MREFKERGKTVIFVSHDIQSVNVFCDTAMWIKDGEIFMRGDSKQVTTSFQNYMLYDKLPDEYHSVAAAESCEVEAVVLTPAEPSEHLTGKKFAGIDWTDLGGLACVGDGRAEIKRMAFVLVDTYESVRQVQGNEWVILLLDIQIKERIENPQIGIVLHNRQGLPALHTNNDICGSPFDLMTKGQEFVAAFRFKLPSLGNGNYIFSVGLQSGLNMPHKIEDAYEFCVSRNDLKGGQCGYVIVEEESFSVFPRPQ